MVAGKRIPDRVIKWASALIFIAFGYVGLYNSVPGEFITLPYVTLLVGLTTLAAWIIGREKSPSGKGIRPKDVS